MRTDRYRIPGLALVSMLTLAYEVVQTRIFSYSLQPVVAFMAIAIAMLGFGVGGTVLSLRPSVAAGGLDRRLALMCLALAASMLAVNMLFVHTSSLVTQMGVLRIRPLWLALSLLPCILPYFLAGLVTACVMQAGVDRIGRIYFSSLAGSAAGCVLAIVLLRPLGAERIVTLCAAAAAAAAVVFAAGGGSMRWIGAAASAACVAVVPFAPSVLPYRPDSNEAIFKLEKLDREEGRGKPVFEFTEWDPLGRIDVFKHGRMRVFVADPTEFRTVTIDGGAMTLILERSEAPGWGKALFEDSMYGAVHHLKKDADVLVIGIGGGTDVNTALYWKARSITGVEISLSTLRALQGPYARFAGWPGKDVEIVHMDGRAFAKSTDRRFDVIQMSGVDTLTMHSAGSMVLAEDYLYTTEAFRDFLEILEPGGVLQVIRFGDEALSLSAIAARALRSLGIGSPDLCIAAMQQSWISGVLVKREPFTADEVDALLHLEDRRLRTGLVIPHYDSARLELGAPIRLLHPPGAHPAARNAAFFERMALGQESEALVDLSLNFVVPTDERPYYMLGSWMALLERKFVRNPYIALVAYSSIVTALAALLLILVPVVWLRRRSGAGIGPMAAIVTYFFMLGACFMLLEVGLISRMVVFVGTPGAAVSVVLASILVSSSLGALASGSVAWRPSRRLWIALAGLACLAIADAFALGPILEPLFGLPIWARGILAAVALAPSGFFMGWFFPTGLSVTASRHGPLVPWAIATNGFASVIGSLAALPLGMALGFRGVFLVAAAGYAVAVLAIMPLALHPAGAASS